LERFFFHGLFRDPEGLTFSIGRLDLRSGTTDRVLADRHARFAIDSTGSQVVLQLVENVGPLPRVRYVIQNIDTGEPAEDITARAASAITIADSERCGTSAAKNPLMSGDGKIVVVLTGANLDRDDVEGCKLFTYNRQAGEWRRILSFPPSALPDLPNVDAEGKLLSFIATQDFGEGGRRTVPMLVSLSEATMIDLPPIFRAYAGFDSVVTRNGKSLVVSSRADPVGKNADHNMELFILQLSSMDVEQVTDTTGGISTTPGGCASLEPIANADGSVIVSVMPIDSVESCHLDGAMRDVRSGLALRRARAIRLRAQDTPPTLTVDANMHGFVGQAVHLDIAFSDPNGDPVTVFAQELGATSLPVGASLDQEGPDRAQLTWDTAGATVGEHVIRVAAFSEGGAVTVHDSTVALSEPCPGDCDYDGIVKVNEVIRGVGIAVGAVGLSTCRAADVTTDGKIGIDELIRSVDALLSGCSYPIGSDRREADLASPAGSGPRG
jgi:hypothetical protein